MESKRTLGWIVPEEQHKSSFLKLTLAKTQVRKKSGLSKESKKIREIRETRENGLAVARITNSIHSFLFILAIISLYPPLSISISIFISVFLCVGGGSSIFSRFSLRNRGCWFWLVCLKQKIEKWTIIARWSLISKSIRYIVEILKWSKWLLSLRSWERGGAVRAGNLLSYWHILIYVYLYLSN